MQEGYEPREPSSGSAGDDDPVIAFLFAQPIEAEPAPAPAAPASRSISRLLNNRGTLYLPTLDRSHSTGGMVHQW